MRTLSIYIHIPFCVKKCRYCDFLSFPAREEEQRRYVQALLTEIRTEAGKYADCIVDSVFIGGGTPSVLPMELSEEIMACLKSLFRFSGTPETGGREPEITAEINPGTVDKEKLERYKRAGINRISIGTQSVHDRELAYLGRIHKAEDFFRTYRMVREAGFTNINVDLMAALPGQTLDSYADNLERIVRLEPSHISAYSLIIEEGTPFYEIYGEGSGGEGSSGEEAVLPLPTEEEEREMDMFTESFLRERGYYRYEISNYALPGMECRHNIGYWTRRNYVGFGLGAASMADNVRWKNLTDMEQYMQRILSGCGTVQEHVVQLSRQEQMEEFMFLGLRLTEGVTRQAFRDTFGSDPEEIYGKALHKLCGQGLLETGESIRLTSLGRDVSNYVMAEFLF